MGNCTLVSLFFSHLRCHIRCSAASIAAAAQWPWSYRFPGTDPWGAAVKEIGWEGSDSVEGQVHIHCIYISWNI